MATVELLYLPDCPNVPAAREQLRRAFAAVGLTAHWTEVNVSDESAPEHARGYGSPTILINGREVTGTAPGSGPSCCVYPESDVRGVPPLETIVAKLRSAPDFGLSLDAIKSPAELFPRK
jgi:mercuric ion transport protein